MMSMQTPDQTFVDLCETLYGPAIDPYAVWETVHKRSPDQADLSVKDGKLRRNVERASNGVGIAAGSLGLAASLKDDRMNPKINPKAGRVARALYSTGKRMPEVSSRILRARPRLAAGLAAGAVGTQVANLGGDALIAGTLKPKKEQASKGLVLAPTGQVAKGWGLPKLGKVTEGLRAAWRPAGTPPATGPRAPKPGTRAAAKATRERNQQAMQSVEHQKQGADAATMISTKSGKAVTGALAGTGVLAGSKKMSRRQGSELTYVPDEYAKRDDSELVFKGQFTEFDDEKRQAFGWASVVKMNGVPVVDRQGDYISIDDLEKAAYDYVHKSRVGGDMHRRNGADPFKVSDMIESVVYTDDKCHALGLPDSFPRGWWVGYQIHDDTTWDLVRKRGRTGFSIHGRGIRRDVDVDELMGAH